MNRVAGIAYDHWFRTNHPVEGIDYISLITLVAVVITLTVLMIWRPRKS